MHYKGELSKDHHKDELPRRFVMVMTLEEKKAKKRLDQRKRRVESRLAKKAYDWSEALDMPAVWYMDIDSEVAVGRLLEYIEALEHELKIRGGALPERAEDSLDEWNKLVREGS